MFTWEEIAKLFQSSSTILHSQQQCMSDLVPHQHLLLSLYFILAILIGVYLSLLLKNYLSIYVNKAKDKSNKEVVWGYRKRVKMKQKNLQLSLKSNHTSLGLNVTARDF